uniref:anthranilate synthase component 2 n=1 Tax=Rhodella violacea TaxID=2801 RepID=UPI001FCE2784|nr:anthranilate synthase component 2 [Rhodella violacea]UNJ18072.1 anthranilate synthase component 2 [Rhodella violacea]
MTRFFAIDNYDSFTYNLVQLIGKLNFNNIVYRNDEISIDEIKKLNPKKIIISPGPGKPIEAGICLDVIKIFAASTPILGICLGHQTIGSIAGNQVIKAPYLMHGKISKVYHNQMGIFKNIQNPFYATRYHSLIVDANNKNSLLNITAWSNDGLIMGCELTNHPNVQGIQFHPESLWTIEGEKIITNFLNL